MGPGEVSAATLRRAHAVHPIAAVQSEYSLWTRNPELGVLAACRELGVTLVASSPLGRGFLTGRLRDTSRLAAGDIRRQMPRFDVVNYAANLRVLERFMPLVAEASCALAQLALSWLLHQGPHVVAIPGTTNLAHLQENLGATQVPIGPDLMQRIHRVFDPEHICGPRYNAQQQREIDTEQFKD